MPSINPRKLQRARERAGLRREAVAVALDRSNKTIECYERGVIIPPGDILVALAALYGVTVEALCDEAPAGAR
jgi:transcriptional regulator with XRE-family HTH domain